MKQTLKIAVPLALLVGIIFAITYFSQYTPPDDGGQGPGVTTSTEPPLRFFTSARRWDPYGSLPDQVFPGFYEVRANEVGTPSGASFWFENRNDKPVTMQLKSVSCSACSGGRLVPLPVDVTRQILQMTAVSTLPGGLFSPLPLGMAGPTANLRESNLSWQAHTFRDNPRAEYKVPAAANTDGWSPQWGILELRFQVGALGPKPLTSEFNLQVDGTGQIGTANFGIAFEGVDPFEVSRSEIDVGELEGSSTLRQFEVVVYSATRGPNGNGPGPLATPTVRVAMPPGVLGEPGPFVSVSEPLPVPAAELPRIANQLAKAIRVESAYRLTVTVSPKVGDRQIDLGPLERDVQVSTADTAKTVRVRGRVGGGVWLDNNLKEIVLQYGFSAGAVGRVFQVITEKPDAELVHVADPTTPDFLEISLEKQTDVTDRGYFRLKVTVPPGKKSGSWSGFVVLEVKGPKPYRIRIPVRGNGSQ